MEKLRREIEILTKEVQEANNKLERIRGMGIFQHFKPLKHMLIFTYFAFCV